MVWLPFFIFAYIGLLIIPIDELIFFRGVAINHQPEEDDDSNLLDFWILDWTGYQGLDKIRGWFPCFQASSSSFPQPSMEFLESYLQCILDVYIYMIIYVYLDIYIYT